MSTTYTPATNTYWPTITIPSGTDGISSTGVNTAFKQLADNEARDKARLDAMTAGPLTNLQVTNLFRVANDAALLAIAAANRIDGMICYVDGIGLYEFLAADTTTALAPLVRQPTDVAGASPGRWKLSGYGVVGAANGIAPVGPLGVTEAKSLRNGILTDEFILLGSPFSASGGSFVTVSGFGLSFPNCVAGDVIRVDAVALVAIAVGAPTSQAIQLFATEGSTNYAHPESLFTFTSVMPTVTPVHLKMIHTVIASGFVSVGTQLQPNGITVTIGASSLFEGQHIVNPA